MQSLQIKQYYQFGNARYDRASLKKANSYSIKHTNLHGCGSGQVQQAIYALQTAQRINTKTLYVQGVSWIAYIVTI